MAEKKHKTKLDAHKAAITITIFLSLVMLVTLCLTGWFIFSSLNEAASNDETTQVKVQGVNIELLDKLEQRQHDRMQATPTPSDLRNPFQPVPEAAPAVPVPAAPAPASAPASESTTTATSPASTAMPTPNE